VFWGHFSHPFNLFPHLPPGLKNPYVISFAISSLYEYRGPCTSTAVIALIPARACQLVVRWSCHICWSSVNKCRMYGEGEHQRVRTACSDARDGQSDGKLATHENPDSFGYRPRLPRAIRSPVGHTRRHYTETCNTKRVATRFHAAALKWHKVKIKQCTVRCAI